MYLDKLAELSDAQDLSQNTGTYLSDYSYDLGAAGTDHNGKTVRNDPGRGGNLSVFITVDEAFVGATATVEFQMVMADNAALTSNLVVLQSTGAIAVATLTAGYQPRLGRVPAGVNKRYLGLRYLIGTATTTAGTCSAYVGSVRETNTPAL